MIILGVDPGTLITGYGLIERRRGELDLLKYGIVRNRSDQSMPLRLLAIYRKLCEMIERYHPDEFAIETAFYGKNAQSALKLGHARGVSMLAAVNFELPTAEYSPREVKKAVAGNGAASKEQVQFMVKSILHQRETHRLYDASDALAVALCHDHRVQNRRAMSTTTDKQRRSRANSWSSFIQQHPERILKRR